MSLLHMDGFSHYSDIRFNRQYANTEPVAPPTGIITSDGPYGEPYSDGPNSGSAQFIHYWGDKNATLPRQKIFMQFHGRWAGTGNDPMFRLPDYTELILPHLSFHRVSNNIQINRGNNTLLAVSTTDEFTDDTWHYFELCVKIHNTEGDLKLILNGSTIIDSTGLDTRNGGSTDSGVTALQRVGTGSNGRQFDIANFLVMSTEGSRLNGFIGERRIVGIFPTGGTTDSDWTRSSAGSTNWELVDENPNSTTDYVSVETTGFTDRYDLSDFTINPTTIDALVVKPTMWINDWGPNHTPTCLVQVSTDVAESTLLYPSGSTPLIESFVVEDDPASGGPGWGIDAIQSMTVGIKV